MAAGWYHRRVTPGPDDRQRAADAYWGLNPVAPTAMVDATGLGPAPRALTIQQLDYIKKATPNDGRVPIIFAVVCLMPVFFMPLAIGSWVLPLGLGGLGAWLRVRALERRRELKRVLEEGEVLPAQIARMQAFEIRRSRYSTVVRYHVVFAVEDRQIELVSYDAGLAMLQVGITVPVVWDRRTPDTIIPAFLLG
jgi:hypothetical protein